MPEQNRLLSPEDDFAYGAGIPRDATWRNLLPIAEIGLSIAPGTGEAMALRDAWNASDRGANALLQGQYGDAAGNYANALLALTGAIPGAGMIARGTRRGTAWMDRNLPQGFNRLLDSMAPRASRDTVYAIPAWHGSPHDFDEFKLDKIGTGEGAQAFGHGLYFAENPETARYYRETLAQTAARDRIPSVEYTEADLRRMATSEADAARKENLLHFADRMKAGDSFVDVVRSVPEYPLMHTFGEDFVSNKAGRLYRTELDVEPEDLLDWDKPLSQQSEKVRAAFAKAGVDPDEVNNGQYPNFSQGPLSARHAYLILGDRLGGGDDLASQALREAGIPGISYLDQGSRGAGEGTRNYVIFDDSLVTILDKE